MEAQKVFPPLSALCFLLLPPHLYRTWEEKISNENNGSWVNKSSIQRSNRSGLEPLGSDSKLLGKDLDWRYANKTLGIHGNVYIDAKTGH